MRADNLSDAEIHKQNGQTAEKAADKLTHEAIAGRPARWIAESADQISGALPPSIGTIAPVT